MISLSELDEQRIINILKDRFNKLKLHEDKNGKLIIVGEAADDRFYFCIGLMPIEYRNSKGILLRRVFFDVLSKNKKKILGSKKSIQEKINEFNFRSIIS